MMQGQPRQQQASSPSFFEFSADRYDSARIIALLEMILVATQKGDVSRAGIRPVVPVPAWDALKREFKRSRLRAYVAQITGQKEGE